MKDFFKYMLATMCGIFLVGIVMTLMCLVSLVSMIALSSSSAETILSPHSVYCLNMEGSVVEHNNTDEFTLLMQELMGDEAKTYALEDVLSNIRKAADNENIDGIYLRGGSLGMGIATAEQIRDALLDFKKTGKFIVAYADSYGQLNYYVASVADRIVLNPEGAVAWNGLSANVSFYTRLLEKIGVEMQVVKVGTYKSAVEPFMLTSMSDANRRQTQAYINEIWDELKADVSASRGISVPALDSLADEYMGIKPQQDYLTSRLVDKLGFRQDMQAVLEEYTGAEDYHLVSHDEMINLAENRKKNSDNKVAIVYAQGDIVDKAINRDGTTIAGDEYVKLFGELAEDENVKAVVLRVNSGGGSAYASEQMNHALELLKAQKPVVVTMGDYAASGGYYMSCNANYIYALPTTLTGSIGIFGLIPSFGGLTDKIGVDYDGVKTNRHSDLETNMVIKGMNAEERALMQAEINRGYDLFTRRCAEGRGMSQDAIKAIAEGRVWTGKAALQLGLVDAMGGMNEAVAKAAELAELGDDYELVNYPEPEDWLTALLDEASGMDDERVAARMEQLVGYESFHTYRYFSSFPRTGCTLHARMPYSIEIQ